jgi:hypothetical protein
VRARTRARASPFTTPARSTTSLTPLTVPGTTTLSTTDSTAPTEHSMGNEAHPVATATCAPSPSSTAAIAQPSTTSAAAPTATAATAAAVGRFTDYSDGERRHRPHWRYLFDRVRLHVRQALSQASSRSGAPTRSVQQITTSAHQPGPQQCTLGE